jgi:hypothetical protein
MILRLDFPEIDKKSIEHLNFPIDLFHQSMELHLLLVGLENLEVGLEFQSQFVFSHAHHLACLLVSHLNLHH